MEFTQELLQSIFDYDPNEPYALRWKNPTHMARTKPGDIAGYWRPGGGSSSALHRFVTIEGHRHIPVHRLVWIYIHGTPPPKQLGFKDGNRGDCRIENLVENPRKLSTSERAVARQKYWGTFRKGFTAEEWTAFIRRRNLKRDYDLTTEEYQALHDEQGGVCAICAKPETLVRRGKVELLCVDHDHETGNVRALLCHQCNNGLGRFFDDPNLLLTAAEYIRSHRAAQAVEAIHPSDLSASDTCRISPPSLPSAREA